MPANSGAVDVTFTSANNRVFLGLPTNRINQLIDTAANGTVIFDISVNDNITTMVVPRIAMIRFSDTGLSSRFIFADGIVALNAEAIQNLIDQTGSGNIFVTLESLVEQPTIDDAPPQVYSVVSVALQPILHFVIGQATYSMNGITQVGDAAPFIADDRAMIPLRTITNALGADVEWNDSTRTVTISQGEQTLILVIDEPLPGGMGTPVIVNNRTFVPTRYVSEMLGAALRWDEINSAVYVYQ